MGTIGFGQIILISLLMLLVFGDVTKLSEKIKSSLPNFRHEKKNRKKGS
jgi:Sec-independent protein translocase protein TatA